MIDGMQQQVHRGNAHHGLIRVETSELLAGERLPLFLGHLLAMVLSDGFGCGNKESRRAARRITDKLAGFRTGKRHHHVPDVLWCAELTVRARGIELAQHVFVQVAKIVSVLHVVRQQLVDAGNGLFKRLGLVETEGSVLHAFRKGVIRMHGFDERERLLADHVKHLLRRKILEPAPTDCLSFLRLREHMLSSHPQHFHVLGFELLVIQGFHEHEIRQLHDDLDGVGDTTLPHALPDVVNLVLRRSGNHLLSSLLVSYVT